jgi:hypothetical protein
MIWKTDADVCDVILDLVEEDYYGLWEIGWRVNNVFGVDATADPAPLAAVVESMLRQHLVSLYVREGFNGPEVPLATSGRSVDLARAATWQVPQAGEPQFLLSEWPEGNADTDQATGEAPVVPD